MQLSAQSINKLCATGVAVAGRLRDPETGLYIPMISPFEPTRQVLSGKSYGLSAASYDLRIAHDLSLDVAGLPGAFAMAHTLEDFAIPINVSAQLCDKSTYARMGVSCFNTFFDPGFIGNGTLELVNLSPNVIVIRSGDPICQMIFNWLDEPTDRPYAGKYQNQPRRAVPAIFEGARTTV